MPPAALTRAYTLVYVLALLTMLTRVQLNLLGRRSYLSSVISLATGTAQSTINLENNDDVEENENPEQQVYGSDFDTNRKYLTFSWWLLNRGWEELGRRVEEAVREVFGHLSPRDLLSFDTFSQLTLEVRKKMEGQREGESKGARWLPFLLPPKDMEAFVLRESGVLGDSATAETQTGTPTSASTISLRHLLDETSDLVESPAFTHVLTQILDASFSVLLNNKVLPGAFDLPTRSTVSDNEGEQRAKLVLLPKILSVLTRQAHVIGHGMPNEYLQEMERVRDLEAFAAVVYSSNWENEIHHEGLMAEAAEGVLSPSQETKPSQKMSTLGDESVVMVENQPSQGSFESTWEKYQGSTPATQSQS